MLVREVVGTYTQYACAGERCRRKRKCLVHLAYMLNQFVQSICLTVGGRLRERARRIGKMSLAADSNFYLWLAHFGCHCVRMVWKSMERVKYSSEKVYLCSIYSPEKALDSLHIYYWSNERSNGELDFIVQRRSRIIPIEVKAEELALL